MPQPKPNQATIAATGHRPHKLGRDTAIASSRLQSFAEEQIILFPHKTTIISGLALGWDQAIAFAAVSLGYPLICAIPHANQPLHWPARDCIAWRYLKSKAREWHVIDPSPQYNPASYQLRNIWMVDRADSILALWNGSPGGTANCIAYAKSKNKPIKNLWQEYKSCQEGKSCQ